MQRIDHIGSLLRPQSLIDAFKQFARNELRPDFFEAAQDDAIREVVAKRPVSPSAMLEELAAVNRAMNYSRAGDRRIFEGFVLRLVQR